ncbi:MAG: hypothetical protein OHK0029_26820 [Armatimonadaceae bacterium]
MDTKLSQNVPIRPETRCSHCGLTAAELHDTGRMGCANCYEVFAPMVRQAVAELHRVTTIPLANRKTPNRAS